MKQFAYAVKHKNNDVVRNSTSGGMFTAISDYVLMLGGKIIGAGYNYNNHTVEFRFCSTKEERDLLKGSLYIQGEMGNIFEQVKQSITSTNSFPILIVGTPCQIDGLRSYLAKNKCLNKHVYLCDIVCHGVPSPGIWKEYISSLENKYGKATVVSFRDKRNGWMLPTAVCICGGNEYPINEFVKLFHSENILRPSCHKCPYADVNRCSDITIGDFWGVEKVATDYNDNEGTSLILLNSQKGIELFEKVKLDLKFKECFLEDCLQPNLLKPTKPSPERIRFWKDYHMNGMVYILEKYASMKLSYKLKRKLRKLFYRDKNRC